MPKAYLVLEDGTVYEGESFGAPVDATGEVVFNTSMTGYQEALTDPSYAGQMLVMTYPIQGNYGVNNRDDESVRIQVNAFIVREAALRPSSWRAQVSLDEYLRTHGIVGLQGIDTRALTRHLRDHGAQDGIVSSTDLDVDRLRERARALPGLVGRDLVGEVTCVAPYTWHDEGTWRLGAGYQRPAPPRFGVVAYDAGIKLNILRQLAASGCAVTVVPAATPDPAQISRALPRAGLARVRGGLARPP